MAGIAAMTDLLLHLLAKGSIMALVKGVDLEDMADLVIKMAKSRIYEIIACPSKKHIRKFHLVTRFENDANQQRMYGRVPFNFKNTNKRARED